MQLYHKIKRGGAPGELHVLGLQAEDLLAQRVVVLLHVLCMQAVSQEVRWYEHLIQAFLQQETNLCR